MNIKKYKKILAIGLIVGMFLIPGTAFAAFNFDDTSEAADNSFDEHGFVGGAFDVAGSAIKDTFEGLFGDTGGDNGDVTSFSGFQGGLSAPSGEGLDPTLTKAKDARQFIVNTVNFALSFLGVIAMVIVIYGGFLYVTSAGNEEQSGKGKKAIMYAVIGILIIIASYALVNTLLTFGGGDSTEGAGGSGLGRGVSEEGSNIGQQSIYNLSATTITGTLKDFATGYKNLAAMESIIKKLKTIRRPDSANENRAFLNQVSSAFQEIKTNTADFSKTHVAAKKFLEGWIAQTEAKNPGSDELDNGAIRTQFLDELEKSKLAEASHADFLEIINELIGKDNKSGRIFTIKEILGEIIDSNANQFTGPGFKTDKDIQKAFAGIDPNRSVESFFKDAVSALTQSRGLINDTDKVEDVVEVAQSLHRLLVIVKNIEFVFVKIRASAKEGHAPLTVELSGLDSRDPAGTTIPDERYIWEPEGHEKKQAGRVECADNRRTGPTITCTYLQSGTYMVSLSIQSADSSRVATGKAFLPITVLPSVARISLKATSGGAVEELRKYEQDKKGNFTLAVDKNEFQVTTEEAKSSGVTFDATGTAAGGGASIKLYEWSFGDASTIEKGETTKTVKHQYKREGKFPLVLEVTDTGNRKDRKFVNVVVGSLAARMETNKTIAEPDELLEFDGSISRSDRGSIASYQWKTQQGDEDVTNFQNVVSIVGEPNASTFRAKFKKPGAYTVTLEVNDGNSTASRTEKISITSRRPRANFSARACPDSCPNTSKPNLVELDAGASFDPDKDPLLFDWKVFDDQGAELEKGGSFEEENDNALSGADAKKLGLKFSKIGKYKIQLTVSDDLPDELKQSDVKEKDVEIASIIELAWDSSRKLSAKLDEKGEAKLTFTGTVLNADRTKIDFGDAESDESPTETGLFEYSHAYKKAGSFEVKVRGISDEGNGENSITARVHISSGDAPLAIIDAFIGEGKDRVSVTLPETTDNGLPAALEVIRGQPIKFSAANSLHTDGSSSGLAYEWDFGDQGRSTEKEITHSYEDLSPEESVFSVNLRVKENDNPNHLAEAQFPVRVISKKPEINTLSLEKKTQGEVTPVDVLLTAEGAVDPDGKITNFQYWYFDPSLSEQKRGVFDTNQDSATITVETDGEENEEHEYIFCVSATDNENATSECAELFREDELPHLKVKNGPNKAPLAAFTVNKTSGRVNEELIFTSSSKDEDGQILQYVWDLDGDGFQNDNPTELATITHQYTKKSPRAGYRVKLKVIDDKRAQGYSAETPIHIEAKSNPPTAKFQFVVDKNEPRRVSFFDESTADTDNGATLTQWKWDFDTSSEFGCNENPKPTSCNGNKTDDADSNDQNPIFQYPASAIYQVKLTVTDSDGNTTEKTSFVNVIAGGAGGTDGGAAAQILKADFNKTDPAFKFENGKKAIHLPANSNGQPVTFFWGGSKGDIASFFIDKNIWCDANANGNREDDPANLAKAASCGDTDKCGTTTFLRYAKTGHPKGPGHFTTRLTVKDRNNITTGEDLEIVFDGTFDPDKVLQFKGKDCDGNSKTSLLKGSIFEKLGAQNTILLGLLGGVIVVLIGIGLASFFKKGQEREI